MKGVKSRTIRFPREISERGTELAERRGISFNELVIESVEERLRKADDDELAAAFDLLGQHPEQCDAEFMLPAAVEVLENDAP
jgi:predicted DNA-binding protein